MKPDVLNKCKTGVEMASIDLVRKENLLPLSDVKLGFGVKTYRKSEKKRLCYQSGSCEI